MKFKNVSDFDFRSLRPRSWASSALPLLSPLQVFMRWVGVISVQTSKISSSELWERIFAITLVAIPGAIGNGHVCHQTLLRLQNCPLWTKVNIVINIVTIFPPQWNIVKILSQVTQCWSSGFATCWTTLRTTWPESPCTLSSTPPMFIKSNRPTSTVSDFWW